MTFLAFTGWHSHELQVGKVVIQIRRRNIDHGGMGFTYKPPLVKVWWDTLGRWF